MKNKLKKCLILLAFLGVSLNAYPWIASVEWDETEPDGATEAVSSLDDYQREKQTAVRERLEQDHYFAADETGLAPILGWHKRIHLVNTGADTTDTNTFYNKGGQVWWHDSQGNKTQITNGGSIGAVICVTSGTIDGATIGVTTPAAGNFSTIGATTPGTGKFTTLQVTTDDPGTPVADTMYKESTIKFFANFDGTGTPTAADSFNLDSITDNGGGDYTLDFLTNFADANYVCVGSCIGGASQFSFGVITQAVGSVRVCSRANSDNSTGDSSLINVIIVGNQS